MIGSRSIKDAFVLRPAHSIQRPLLKHIRPYRDETRSGVSRESLVVRSAVEPADRALGAAPYLLPLLDGLRFGTYLFNTYPVFIRILTPIIPLAELYQSLPFASLLVFFLLYFGVARNSRLSRFVRFNAMQAILIDILQILPGLLTGTLRVSREIQIPIYNFTWLYIFCCTAIGIGSCLSGQVARLPLVADASESQISR